MKFVATRDLIALKFIDESLWDDAFIYQLLQKYGSKFFDVIKQAKPHWIKKGFTIDPSCIKYINNPSRIEIKRALEFNTLLLQYVPKQTQKIEMKLIKKNGLALEFCQSQDDKIRMLAVKQNGNALQFVAPENQTEELCLAAVSQKPGGRRETDLSSNNALNYVHKQTQEIINAALLISPNNRAFIKEIK